MVELDGDAHFYSAGADLERQKFLEDQGITVIRFANYDVMHRLDYVLETIFAKSSGHLSGQ